MVSFCSCWMRMLRRSCRRRRRRARDIAWARWRSKDSFVFEEDWTAMILAGDVGGTKVHLALYNFVGGRLDLVRENKFPSSQNGSLDEVVKAFLAQAGGAKEEIIAACFGCPGPVRNGRIKLTNLPWTLDERELEKSVGIEHVFLINDLEANG